MRPSHTFDQKSASTSRWRLTSARWLSVVTVASAPDMLIAKITKPNPRLMGAAIANAVIASTPKPTPPTLAIVGRMRSRNTGERFSIASSSFDRSISASHIPHNLVFNYQWDLPFGKGKKFLNRGGVINHIVGRWNLSGITSLQSGSPISIDSRVNTTASQGGGQRPNSTGISSKSSGSTKERINGWFNNAAFVDAPPYTFGNVGRFLPDNPGPPLHNWDVSLLKDFGFTERYRLQFRAELFNAFNIVNFRNPAITFGQPNFGVITAADPARVIQFGLKFYY